MSRARDARSPSFPPERAFVVQFDGSPSAGVRRFVGRVEHVLSGRSARFRTRAALVDFMRMVIADFEPAGESPP